MKTEIKTTLIEVIQSRLDKLHAKPFDRFSKYIYDAEVFLSIEKEYIMETSISLDEYITEVFRVWNKLNDQRQRRSKLFNPIRFVTYRDLLKTAHGKA